VTTCACGCGRPLGTKNDARGLAGTCYRRLSSRLDLDDWTELRAQGATREEAARRLGMALESFEQVLYRHRGDPRAAYGVRRRERVA
jgi:hypothetical protein